MSEPEAPVDEFAGLWDALSPEARDDANLIMCEIFKSAITYGLTGELVVVTPSPPVEAAAAEIARLLLTKGAVGRRVTAALSVTVRDLGDGKASIAWTFTPKSDSTRPS